MTDNDAAEILENLVKKLDDWEAIDGSEAWALDYVIKKLTNGGTQDAQ